MSQDELQIIFVPRTRNLGFVSLFYPSFSQLLMTSSKSRQDYIAKVRYQNDLPAPPCPPKLLKYEIEKEAPQKEFLKDSRLLSALFSKDNFRYLMNETSDGLDVNYLRIPGIIENEKSLGKLFSSYKNLAIENLHPDDRLLLVDPNKSATLNEESPVFFLRRPQYVSDGEKINLQNFTNKRKHQDMEDTNPRSQLHSVERTFDEVIDPRNKNRLQSLIHPRKKIKAVKAWHFFPDTSTFDQVFHSLKFVGSASLSKDRPLNEQLGQVSETDSTSVNASILTSLFKPIEINPHNKWISLYAVTDKLSAESFRKSFNSIKDDNIVNRHVIYDHIKDFDQMFRGHKKLFEDFAISFDDISDRAFFVPIVGRLELKKKRIVPGLVDMVNRTNYAHIRMDLRNPSTQETAIRDSRREQYDPVNYSSIQEE